MHFPGLIRDKLHVYIGSVVKIVEHTHLLTSGFTITLCY